MISFLCIRFIIYYDNESEISMNLKDAMIMAFTEILLFLLYLSYEPIYGGRNIIVNVLVAVVYAVYHNVTAYIDFYTGYVYQVLNLLCQIIVLLISIFFFGVSPEFILFYILFMGVTFLCEKVNAFFRGDTEFLIVSYCFFTNDRDVWCGIEFMLTTLLISTFIFDVFRRITGRKEESLPYTPFIVLSEIINMLIQSCFV